jgi:hypothetical protein
LVGAIVLTLSVWFAGTAAVPALLAAVATLAQTLVAPASDLALLLRFIAGAAMAGVYPVRMKLAASWAKGDLGLLTGLVVGAATLGSALPHALHALIGVLDSRVAYGGAGVLAALAADRWDRAKVAGDCMLASGSCALLIGSASAWPLLALVIAFIWGLTVVADSAQFSACIVSFSPPDYVGTMLTVQTALGFSL